MAILQVHTLENFRDPQQLEMNVVGWTPMAQCLMKTHLIKKLLMGERQTHINEHAVNLPFSIQ